MISDLLQHDRVFKRNTGKYQITFTNLHMCEFNKLAPRNGVHTHDCFEICFASEGEGIFCNEKKQFPIHKNCIFTGEPFVPHEIILGSCTRLVIYFLTFQIAKLDEHADCTADDSIIENFLIRQSTACYNQAHIRDYIRMLDGYALHGGTYAADSITYIMTVDMLKSLAGRPSDARPEQTQFKRTIDYYIYQNLNRKITVSDLCLHSGLSERNLFYNFRHLLHTTPNEYILNVKISASIGALKMGMSVKSIAIQYGFNDSSCYCRTFKKIKGYSPLRFLNSSASVTVDSAAAPEDASAGTG